MTDAFTAIGSALFAHAGTAVGVPFYHAIAPQGGTPPYVVYQQQATFDEYQFGDGDDSMVQADYAVRVVSNRNWPGEAQLIYGGSVHPRLQAAALSVAGHKLLRCERISAIPPYLDREMYWHVGGVYRIVIQGTA